MYYLRGEIEQIGTAQRITACLRRFAKLPKGNFANTQNVI